jgi:hypothetical protein
MLAREAKVKFEEEEETLQSEFLGYAFAAVIIQQNI